MSKSEEDLSRTCMRMIFQAGTDVGAMPIQLELGRRYMIRKTVLLLSHDFVLVLHIQNLLKFRLRKFEPTLSLCKMFRKSKYSFSSSNTDTMKATVDF